MKKITLVLCACAMAFAGLLVSCSNDAGSGDVKLIYRDATTYDYVYQLSGTQEVVTNVTPTGDKRDLLTTHKKTTSFNGLAELSWAESNDIVEDYKNYSLEILGTKDFKSEDTESYDGTGASSQGTFKKRTTINVTTVNVPDVDFYEFAEAFYMGTAFYDEEHGIWVTAYETAADKEGDDTITVTGDIAEDDEITIVVKSYTDYDNDTDENTVNNVTTTWTYKLSKAAPSEE